jgi:predicted phage terminase large subunit-like protein
MNSSTSLKISSEDWPSLAEIRTEKRRRSIERQRLDLERNSEAIRGRCVSLHGFIKEAWRVLEPKAKFVDNWHIRLICEHLEAITFGRLLDLGLSNRLLINVPPGSMKSLLVSVMWQAWEWGPCGLRSMRYLSTAYNDGPVNRDTRKTRNLIASEWYQSLWPEVVLTRKGETSFENSDTGNREGVAFGSLTSQRGDRLIIDDPHSTETAESDAERNATTRKFREGALNRLNDQKRSAIVVIMQRLHEVDLSGVIKSLGMDFTHVMLPMEFEAERKCVTPIGEDPRTEDGDLLDPVRMPRDELDKLKRGMTQYAIAGQYQQRPSPREGGLFKRHWFDFVRAAPAQRRICRGWDLAASKKKAGQTTGPAFTAGVKLSVANGTYYVENSVREQGSPAEVDKLIKNTAVADGTHVTISIPQDPGQAAISQKLAFGKLLAGFECRFSAETGDKETRANPVSAQAEIGNIKIIRTGDPARDAWIAPFLDEVCLFPSGKFKDQTDALSRAFQQLLKPAAPPPLVGSYSVTR